MIFSSRWSLFPLTWFIFSPQTNEASSESIASSPKRDTMSSFLPDSTCYELLTIIGNSGGLEDQRLLCEQNNFCRFLILFLMDCLFFDMGGSASLILKSKAQGLEQFLSVLPKVFLKLQCFLFQAEALKTWWLWTWPGINPQESMWQWGEWTWRPAQTKWSHSCR